MTCDLLVLGLGPAGCVAALRAVRQGATVTLAGERAREGLAGEHLPPEGVAVLRSLGLGPPPCSHTCPGVRLAWGGEVTEIDHLAHPFGTGCVVERPAFEEWLLDQARGEGARVVESFRLTKLSRRDGRWLATSARRHLSSEQIVDATGRSAAVARRLGARRYRCDRLLAVGARLQGGSPDRFLTVVSGIDGWWYTLALPSGTRTVVYLTDADLLGGMGEPRTWWRHALGAPVLADLIQGCEAPGRLLTTTAHTSFLDPCQGPGWRAVGDAAASLDPLSARGLSHGLSSRSEVNPSSFLRSRWQAYAGEPRWPQSPFWQRRVSSAGHSGIGGSLVASEE